MQAWNVYLADRVIDTVFFVSGCDAGYVRRELIYHDGYDAAITVEEGL